MHKLRIALVIPGLSQTSTGPSVSVRELAEKLSSAGHEVTLVASDLVTGSGASGEMVKIDHRVNLRLFPAVSRVERRLYRSKPLKRWFEDQASKFDLVDIQGVWSFTTVDAATACRRVQVPYILTPRGQMARWDWRKRYGRKKLFFWLYLRQAWHGAAAVRFLSLREARDSVVAASARSVVIPNWVNVIGNQTIERRSQLRDRLALAERAPIILFLGRMTAQKGVTELVQAFDVLFRRRSDCILLLVGPIEEPYCTLLKRSIAGLACCSNIRFLDPVYDNSKFDLLSLATVFVTLSKSEGMPVAVLEAMASGVPAVVTNAANVPEIAEHSAGLVIQDDPLSVAAAVLSIINNEKQRAAMGCRAKKLVKDRFSPEVVLPQLISFYRSISRNQ